jgi:hypothetical protein
MAIRPRKAHSPTAKCCSKHDLDSWLDSHGYRHASTRGHGRDSRHKLTDSATKKLRQTKVASGRSEYDEAARNAALLTAATRKPEATAVQHRAAAAANLDAATKARDSSDARGHEHLAAAHERVAVRLEGKPELSVAEIARAVTEMLPRIGSDGRYGPYKVFVSEIWRRLSADPRFHKMSLPEFKDRLMDANQEGWLNLARADFVGAMNREQVHTSEIRDRGASFHFVLDE